MMKHIFNELKQQPLISAITVVGTALAIFLIMVVVMLQQVKIADFAPESNRSRMLHWTYCSITNASWDKDDSANAPMSYRTFNQMFDELENVEVVTAYQNLLLTQSAGMKGETSVSVKSRPTDANYFKVFDLQFINGAPYTDADFHSGLPKIVISESVARKIFKSTDVVGREILLNMAPFQIVGVVKDVSKLATFAYADVWYPFTAAGIERDMWNDGYQGMISATILAPSRSDFPKIRGELDRRIAALNTTMKEADGYQFITRNRPYDQEKQVAGTWANVEPDVEKARHERWIIYIILVIVPAINLSSMTRSRLSKRKAEIAVRRAFGASSANIAASIVVENLIITLLAGAVGLLVCLIFAWLCAPYLWSTSGLKVNLGMIMQWSTFGWAILFCFILNLLCSLLPAWSSSRESIVNSLSGNNR